MADSSTQKIRAYIPVTFVNGEKLKGQSLDTLFHGENTIQVEAEADKIPDSIQIDLTSLAQGKTNRISVEDIASIPNVRILSDPKKMIVSTLPETVVETPTTEEENAAEKKTSKEGSERRSSGVPYVPPKEETEKNPADDNKEANTKTLDAKKEEATPNDSGEKPQSTKEDLNQKNNTNSRVQPEQRVVSSVSEKSSAVPAQTTFGKTPESSIPRTKIPQENTRSRETAESPTRTFPQRISQQPIRPAAPLAPETKRVSITRPPRVFEGPTETPGTGRGSARSRFFSFRNSGRKSITSNLIGIDKKALAKVAAPDPAKIVFLVVFGSCLLFLFFFTVISGANAGVAGGLGGSNPTPPPITGSGGSNPDATAELASDIVITGGNGYTPTQQDINEIMQIMAIPYQSLKYRNLLTSNGTQKVNIVLYPSNTCGTLSTINNTIFLYAWLGCPANFREKMLIHESGHVIAGRSNLESQFPLSSLSSTSEDGSSCYIQAFGGQTYIKTYSYKTTEGAGGLGESFPDTVSDNITPFPLGTNQGDNIPNYSTTCANTYNWIATNIYGGCTFASDGTADCGTSTPAGGDVSAGTASSDPTCGGKYTEANQYTSPDQNPHENFGDPNCNFTIPNFVALVEQLDPTNARKWVCQISYHEARYSPNDFTANTKSSGGGWGLFDMNGGGFTANGPTSMGNVEWHQQVENAISYNKNKIGGNFTYWSTRDEAPDPNCPVAN